MTLDVLGRVYHAAGQALLVTLALEDLLLDRAGGDEAVYKSVLFLPVAPHPRQRLLVRGWIPVWIKEHQPIGADQIEPTTTGFAGEEEDELGAFGIVELVHQLLPLVDVHRAVES